MKKNQRDMRKQDTSGDARVEKAGQRTQDSPMFVKSKLKPIFELWPKVRDILGVDDIDAVCFVERTFGKRQVTLYLDDEATGLWVPHVFDDKVHQMILDMGVSDFAQHFFSTSMYDEANFDGWDKFRITPRDFNTIIQEATEVANAEPEGEDPLESPAAYLDPGHPHYASKLAAAVAAWQAVTSKPELLRGSSPKAAMERWLRENASRYGLLKENGTANEQGIEEITKVANWKTKGGAPSTPTT